jgi:hypothetical protein
MKNSLFTGAALAAVLALPVVAIAQTTAPSPTPPSRSDTAPGQYRPPATTDAPGKSESAPGQNRPPTTTTAPSRSEPAPGQTRGDTTNTQPGSKPTPAGRSEMAPGQNRPPANTAAPGKSESAPGQNRPPATTAAPGKSESAPGQTRPDEAAKPSSSTGTPTGSTGATTGKSGTTDTDRSTASTRGGGGGVNVNLDAEKRTRVTEAFTKANVKPLSNVNFSITVGTTINQRVDFRPLPIEIVQIVPEFRGYQYIMVRDEIVIVEPKTRRIVYVLDRNGRPRGASLTITPQHRTLLKQRLVDGPRMTRSIKIEDGMIVPPDVELRPIDNVVVTEVPEIRPYRYFVVENQVVLVEPESRRVVEIIR